MADTVDYPLSLSDKMRLFAVENSEHPRVTELKDLADKFDAVSSGFYSDPQTVDVRKFLGCWARARRAWYEVSGEPLI